MVADLVDEWPVILIAAGVILVAMVLAYRLMNRDPDVRRTRYGFFVERDRYTEPDGEWPGPLPAPHTALPNWPDRDTTAASPLRNRRVHRPPSDLILWVLVALLALAVFASMRR